MNYINIILNQIKYRFELHKIKNGKISKDNNIINVIIK
jgi:hypothetical protein